MSTTLHDVLAPTLAASSATGLCVALSGGPDSSALLHALAQLPQARGHGLRALHVDHGLHAASADWAKHCQAFCETLEVPLRIDRVRVDDSRGEGAEAAARRARHAVFAEALRDGEWLALAHHRDDQVETVLLKLLRGAGPEGLGGMRELRPFGQGFLWRPLLGISRVALLDYLASHALRCIADPANDDPRFSRNLLRNQIIPDIARHWPHADASILHSARLCREVAGYVENEAEAALAALRRQAGTLDADDWLALPDALRAPVLHQWLNERDLPAPGDAQYRELRHQASTAVADAMPCVAWPGAEVRIWDGRLHATPPLPPRPDRWQTIWDGKPLALPGGCGSLILEATEDAPGHDKTARFDPPLLVRMRHGGERIKPAGDVHTRELRDLFQQARVPPWLRERCPLIFANGELIAVAGAWISEAGMAIFPCNAKPRWLRPAWGTGVFATTALKTRRPAPR